MTTDPASPSTPCLLVLNVSTDRGTTEIVFEDEQQAVQTWEFFVQDLEERRASVKARLDGKEAERLLAATLRSGPVLLRSAF